MNIKRYRQFRVVIALFVGTLVAFALNTGNFILLIASVLAGMAFMTVVRLKTKINTDEREASVQEKAAKTTYAIFAPTIGITALLLLFPSHSGLSVFSKGEFEYIESLGMIFAYLALLQIAIYAISYHFFNRKYGGGGNEE